MAFFEYLFWGTIQSGNSVCIFPHPEQINRRKLKVYSSPEISFTMRFLLSRILSSPPQSGHIHSSLVVILK